MTGAEAGRSMHAAPANCHPRPPGPSVRATSAYAAPTLAKRDLRPLRVIAALFGAVSAIPLAYALVALLQRQLGDEQLPSLGSVRRDALVSACVDALGGRELGVKDWITTRLVGFGKRWATAKARREREALYSAAYPAAGDILLYQARGQAIRDFIARRVAACGDGVAILAHSLGGIACVDLLVERALPNVELLVTAGNDGELGTKDDDTACSASCSRRPCRPNAAFSPSPV